MKGRNDILWKTKPLLEMVNKTWKDFLAVDVHDPEIELFRKHERSGRPLRVDFFIGEMESFQDRRLKPQKPGPQKKDK